MVGVEPMDEGVEDEIEAPGPPLVGAGLGSDGAGQAAQAGGGSSAVPPVSQAVPLEAGSSTGGGDLPDEVADRAQLMFLTGSGDVCPTGRGWLRAEADFELLGAVEKAVTDIFAGHRAEIQQSCGPGSPSSAAPKPPKPSQMHAPPSPPLTPLPPPPEWRKRRRRWAAATVRDTANCRQTAVRAPGPSQGSETIGDAARGAPASAPHAPPICRPQEPVPGCLSDLQTLPDG